MKALAAALLAIALTTAACGHRGPLVVPEPVPDHGAAATQP
ncbi:MAG: lipoprotein [Leptospirillia bacterium]